MHSFVCVNFIIILLVLFGATKGYSEEDFKYSPIRRSKWSNSGSMFSAPRVGRSDPTLMSNLHDTEAWLNDLCSRLYNEIEDSTGNMVKRPSFADFPRVGRSDPELQKFADWLKPDSSRLSKRSLAVNTQTKKFEQKEQL